MLASTSTFFSSLSLHAHLPFNLACLFIPSFMAGEEGTRASEGLEHRVEKPEPGRNRKGVKEEREGGEK